MELEGQFDESRKDVLLVKTQQFCSAVDKNGEGVNDPTAGLTCYSTKPGPSDKRQVVSTDQFGEHWLDVKKKKTQLCVPSQVLGAEAPEDLDHFEIYGVKTTKKTEKFEKTEVELDDDPYMNETVELKKLVGLGVPTDKNREGIINPRAHLTCYSMRAPRFPKTGVEVINQFGIFRLTLKKPNMLCVPSYKVVVEDE